jgi:hypothetical protein
MAKAALSRVICKTSEDSGRDNALQVRLLADRRHKALTPIQYLPYADVLVHGVPPDAMF